MYEVILVAEDGEYTLTGPMPESDALKWIEKNESSYGEDRDWRSAGMGIDRQHGSRPEALEK